MQDIKHASLLEFLRRNAARESELAEFTNQCGASDLVEKYIEIDPDKNRGVTKYRFSENVKQTERLFRSYYVWYFRNSAYLIYRRDEDIKIWVCYTEEGQRRKGLMTRLLTALREFNAKDDVMIHTYDEGLLRVSKRIGIKIFRAHS